MRFRKNATGLLLLTVWLPLCKAYAQDSQPSNVSKVHAMHAQVLPMLMTAGTMTDLDNPASYLYKSWNTSSAFKYDNMVLPDTVLVDMGGYRMPTDNRKISDVFGYRPKRGRWHMGLDVKVAVGDTIRAAFDGKVRYSDYDRRGYGHYLVIRHPNGLETLYGHLSKKLVDTNQIVHAGTPIGLGGNTGRSTGSHLHFETRVGGVAIDPSNMFDFPEQKMVTDCYAFLSKTQPEYYKVRSGDTLSRIAARHRTSVSKICSLNGITSKSTLRIGQQLRVK